jgi:hypothetical protein
MFFLALVMCVMPEDGQTPLRRSFVPEMLVRAKVTDVTRQGQNWETATLVIDQVFAGTAKLTGTRFQVTAPVVIPFRSGVYGPSLLARFQVGEVGLWILRRAKAGQRLLAGLECHPPVEECPEYWWRYGGPAPLPARRVISSRDGIIATGRSSYDSVLKWAQVVQVISQAARERQTELLKKYSHGGDPLIEPWAIRVLARNDPLAPAFLKELAENAKLTIPGQVTLDAVLCEVIKKDWQDSALRLRLLQGWISGELGDDESARWISDRLRAALRDRELDIRTWLRLVMGWITNQSMSKSFRFELLNVSPFEDLRGTKRQNEEQYVFDVLIQLIRKNAGTEVKLAAAQLLFSVSWNDSRLRTVRALLKETLEEDVRTELRAVLNVAEQTDE